MPDLGNYAGAVLLSYAAAIAILIAIVLLSLWRGTEVRAEIARIEGTNARKGSS